MLLFTIACLMIAPLASAGSSGNTGEKDASDWKVAYWVWNAYRDPDLPPPGDTPVALLYVAVGEYYQAKGNVRNDSVEMSWPDKVPDAESYVAVVKFEGESSPRMEGVQEVITRYGKLKNDARGSGRALVGLQLDFDCPSGKLKEYARFLESLRALLPGEDSLSVTALLDWFRPGTAVREVMRTVDEFVPQFYDVSPESLAGETTGAAHPVDPSRWAGVFNSFGRRYRIGIASFGRVLGIAGEGKGGASAGKNGRREVKIFDDSPLELMAGNRLRLLSTRTSRAGETVLWFRNLSGRATAGDRLPPGATVKMIIPTRESVSSAYRGARAMGGQCAGVVFFRWPLANEAMVLTRDELEGIVSGSDTRDRHARIEADDGLCAAVTCADLYLRLQERFPRQPLTFRIRASADLEYFLPFHLVRTGIAGARQLEVSVPAYAGVPRIYLGRAVSKDPVEFTLEEVRK